MAHTWHATHSVHHAEGPMENYQLNSFIFFIAGEDGLPVAMKFSFFTRKTGIK